MSILGDTLYLDQTIMIPKRSKFTYRKKFKMAAATTLNFFF